LILLWARRKNVLMMAPTGLSCPALGGFDNHQYREPESGCELRRRAKQYRAMAARIDDARAVQALHELADEYEALAEKIASQPDANPNKGTT
jgi:hypothetical protein